MKIYGGMDNVPRNNQSDFSLAFTKVKVKVKVAKQPSQLYKGPHFP